MANIPTIPGSAQVQTQQIGTKRNVGPQLQALGQLRNTIGKAAGAIDESVGAIAEYEERKRRAEEAYVFNSSSLSFQKLHSQFLSNAKKLPDEQIVPQWTQTTQAWKQSQLDQYGSKLSKRAKQMFMMKTDNAIGGATAKFQVMADKLGVKRRVATGDANSAEAIATGDPNMIKLATRSQALLVASGDQTQAQMDHKVAQFGRALQESQINNGIDANPHQTVLDIKAGKYDQVVGPKRDSLLNQAERQEAYVQKTSLSDLTDAFQKDPKNPASDDTLDQMVKAGTLTGEGVKQYHAMVTGKNKEIAKQAAAVLHMDISDHDWIGDDNPEQTARDMGEKIAGLPIEAQKEPSAALKQHLDAARKQEAREEQPVKQMTYDLGKKAYKDGIFTPPTEREVSDTSVKVGGFLGFFTHPGTKKVSVPAESDWEQDASPKQKAAATVAHAEWRQGMDAFFKAKPKATPEEAEAEATRLLQPHTDAQTRQNLGLNPPPSGAAFYSKSTGKWYDKNKKEIP